MDRPIPGPDETPEPNPVAGTVTLDLTLRHPLGKDAPLPTLETLDDFVKEGLESMLTGGVQVNVTRSRWT